jgi:hypothetical protein
MGIELMLAVGHNARNGRFREAFAAFLNDRCWPILPLYECLLCLGPGARLDLQHQSQPPHFRGTAGQQANQQQPQLHAMHERVHQSPPPGPDPPRPGSRTRAAPVVYINGGSRI